MLKWVNRHIVRISEPPSARLSIHIRRPRFTLATLDSHLAISVCRRAVAGSVPTHPPAAGSGCVVKGALPAF
eukprot:1221982-Pyramimonas_sp.AAC.1